MKKKNKIMTIISVFLVSVSLFSAIFIFLYYHDNKYTHKGTQPIAGTLILNQENLTKEKTFYLSRGWQFYPNQLLMPIDFADGYTMNGFMQDIDIGKYNTFSFIGNSNSPVGGGTYRLIIQLPNQENVYSLVIPEIYSSYTLYINGEQLANMGNPSPNDLVEKIGEQTLTFIGQGKVELIIMVTNHSHFYSGLTFPPLFGLSDAVALSHTTRILIGSIALFLSIGIALFSLYLYFKIPGKKDKRILLFFGISFCISVSYLYPVVLNYLILSPKPWYALELLAIYGIYLFVVLLQNEICEVDQKKVKIVTGIIGSFCVLALLYGLIPSYSNTLVQWFGYLSHFIKLLTAVYLLYNAIISIIEDKTGGKKILFCTTGFSLALLFDRIFPAFEPIYCGWFPEYGGVIMLLGLGSILWSEVTAAYRLQLVFAQEKHQLTQQVAIQKVHYLELTNKIKETTRIRHDDRHHLKMLYSFLENKDYLQLEHYLSEHIIATFPDERTLLCENLIIDAVLQYFRGFCKEHHITFICNAEVPPMIPIKDTELSVLLGNLVENAYDAVLVPECLNPFISAKIKFEQSKLILLIENSYAISPREKGNKFLSTKHNGYGIGTESIKSIVQLYNGQLSYRYENHVFCASIILYLDNKE